MAEPIKMLFGQLTHGLKKLCIRWDRDPPWEGAIFKGCSAHWKASGSLLLLQCMQQNWSFNCQ